MLRRSIPWAAAALALSLVASSADAQEVHEGEAKALFQAGSEALRAGRFEEAIEYFQRAHQLSGRVELFYNIAIVADRLRRDELALSSFEAYLAGVPDTPRRAEIERRIETLRQAIEEKRARAIPPSDDVAEDHVIAEPTTPTKPRQRPSSFLRRKRVWTWVLLGAGAAVAGGGALTWWRANVTHDRLAARCQTMPCTQADIDASFGPELVLLTNVAWGVAGGLLAGAVLAFLLEGSGAARTETSPVALELSPSRTMVHLDIGRMLEGKSAR